MASVDRFIEEMGLMFQETGDPRISGRIFALLLIEGHELSLLQISDRLAVSRASVSTNARMLVKRGMIRRTAHSGDRQDFYELGEFPSVDMLGEMVERILRQAKTIQAFVAPIRLENAAASGRVEELSKAVGQSAKLLRDWAAALHEEKISKDQK